MVRKLMVVLVALVFAASFLTMTSCAKKAVKVDEGAKPAEVKAAPPAAKSGDDREKQLRELEQAEKLRAAMKAFEAESIYFDYDKADIKAEAKATLENKAAWLRANSQFKVTIEGNCDERGTNEYNMALGERRAKAAQKFLNAMGISADRMSTISYGEEKPAVPGHDEKAWAKNRRDDFKLSK